MTISFDNQSSFIQPKDLADFQDELWTQLQANFAPYWGLPLFPGVTITLLDYPDPALDPEGALGYHALNAENIPYARVFVKLAEEQGIAWTRAASHETLELAADPRVKTTTYLDDGSGTSGWLVAQEICDPVELQYYNGPLHGVSLSNFVLPTWYVPGYSGQVDYLNLLPGPLRIASGGYASATYVEQATGWQTFQGFIEKVRK